MLFVVGIGAGLVSALLFSVVITGSPLAVLLYSAAPLPIFIAALGWNHRAGLIAIGAGAVAIAVALSLPASIAFAVIVGLPAWWIAYLALLAKTDDRGTTQWYPLGHLLVWIAATATLVTVGSALVMTTDYEAYLAAITRIIEGLLAEMIRGKFITLSADAKLPEIAQLFAPAVPVGIGASFVITIIVNLWLAAKTVAMSGRLVRPWPFIPATTIPKRALLLFALAAGGFVLGGFAAIAGAALAGALFTALMFSGLAMVHDVTRGKGWRAPALISIYVALVVMQALVTPLLVLAGLADSLFRLRTNTPPPPSVSPTL